MFSKRPASTPRSISVAGALIALCLALSGASAQASAPSVSAVHASPGSSAFSGDAYINEMGIMGADDDATMHGRTKVTSPYFLPEIGDEVLTHEPLTAPLGSTKGSFIDGSAILPYIEQDN